MINSIEELITAAPGTVAFDMFEHYAGYVYDCSEVSEIEVTRDALASLLALAGADKPANYHAYVIDHDRVDGMHIIVLGGYYDGRARLITITA